MQLSNKTKLKFSTIIVIIGTFLVVMAIVFFVIAINHSNTTTVGEYPEPSVTHSLTCKASNVAYPFFTEDNSSSQDLKITMIITNNGMNSISLLYTIHYPDEAAAASGRSLLHSAMNTSFAQDNLPADSFDAVYSTNAKSVKLNLYATAKNLNGTNEKYFLLDGANGSYKPTTLKSIYAQKNLKCVEK